MAILTEPTQLPGYTEALAEHKVALKEAGDDEAAKLKAQLAWSERQRQFDSQLVAHNDSERKVVEAKARLAAEYPDVPESVYASAATPEAMEEHAKAFNEALQAKVAAANPQAQQQQQTAAAAGQPPVGADGGHTPQPGFKADYISAVDKFNSPEAQKSQYLRKQAADQILNVGFNGIVGPILKNARAEANRSK